jgi:hypothetical protein
MSRVFRPGISIGRYKVGRSTGYAYVNAIGRGFNYSVEEKAEAILINNPEGINKKFLAFQIDSTYEYAKSLLDKLVRRGVACRKNRREYLDSWGTVRRSYYNATQREGRN